MSTNNKQLPLVSVVTPVYNGEKYLAECVESVLAQTYSNWEYIILNNRSTDRTLEIVEEFAAKDSRVKVCTNEEFLSQTVNWNAAVRKISQESRYCLLLMADDWIFPGCIEKKVELAEEHPSVGLVGSYRLMGTRVAADRIPYPSPCTSGREIGRRYLVEDYHLGTPTNILMRSDLVRGRDAFYDETVIHADRMAFLELLLESDYGFVHEVLTFDRRHDETTTALVADRFQTSRLDKLVALLQYGPRFFDQRELDRVMRHFYFYYYRFLAKLWLATGTRDARRYHRTKLRELGHRIDKRLFLKAMLTEMLDLRATAKRVFTPNEKLHSKSSRLSHSDRSLDAIGGNPRETRNAP